MSNCIKWIELEYSDGTLLKIDRLSIARKEGWTKLYLKFIDRKETVFKYDTQEARDRDYQRLFDVMKLINKGL